MSVIFLSQLILVCSFAEIKPYAVSTDTGWGNAMPIKCSNIKGKKLWNVTWLTCWHNIHDSNVIFIGECFDIKVIRKDVKNDLVWLSSRSKKKISSYTVGKRSPIVGAKIRFSYVIPFLKSVAIENAEIISIDSKHLISGNTPIIGMSGGGVLYKSWWLGRWRLVGLIHGYIVLRGRTRFALLTKNGLISEK